VSRLRVACVGTGFIAGRHLAALAGLDDVEVVAVADPVRERADAAAGPVGARAYDDGLALLETEELDAVWLCVPPFAHGPLEQAAVARSLPFFVEKPLSADLATAVDVAARVRTSGLLTGVGYHWRHLALVQQAAELLRATPAQLVTGTWLDRTPPPPWWSQRSMSGGQVVEQTTHLYDLVRLLVGEVTSVHAVEVGPDGGVPTASSAVLRFASGAVGSISSTRVLDRRHRVGLHLSAPERAVELVERALSDHELRVDGGEGLVSGEDPIAAEDREFVAALRGEGTVSVPYEEGLRSHALAWAADLSAREGRTVEPAAVLERAVATSHG
jgi:myo-inositol 2-dehydrogenase/D-chiro-inositol 1-dehydrogenase